MTELDFHEFLWVSQSSLLLIAKDGFEGSKKKIQSIWMTMTAMVSSCLRYHLVLGAEKGHGTGLVFVCVLGELRHKHLSRN